MRSQANDKTQKSRKIKQARTDLKIDTLKAPYRTNILRYARLLTDPWITRTRAWSCGKTKCIQITDYHSKVRKPNRKCTQISREHSQRPSTTSQSTIDRSTRFQSPLLRSKVERSRNTISKITKHTIGGP